MPKKNKISLIIFKPLANKIFAKSSNRDGLNDYIIDLKKKLSTYNIDLSTYDINKPKDSAIVIYLNFLFSYPNPNPKNYNILIHTESPCVFKNHKDKFRFYDQIYTWDLNLIDKNIYPYFWGFDLKKLKKHSNIEIHNKNKFACMIYSNKFSNSKNELYSERIKIIKYIDNNKINDIHLFGFNWKFRASIKNLISNLSIKNLLNYIFYSKPKCYQGIVKNKNAVLKKYKFCFCFENFKSDSEYFTEKIFDCLFAYTIPIYFGSSKISKFVPQNCFIDYSNFNSVAELEEFLRFMPKKKYEAYLANIKNFLISEKARKSSLQYNNELLIDNILKHFE